MSTQPWARAALVPVHDGSPRPEVVSLGAELPSLDELFTFMRDAELRWSSLRMRIEEHAFGGRGEKVTTSDVAIRHPGHARVVTSESGRGMASGHELWLSDGETIWTYSAAHRSGTKRPARGWPRGLGRSFPGRSRVYQPQTALPMETLPQVFIHPAGYCQNVLASGACQVAGTDRVIGREAIIVVSDHPRVIERVADRPDFSIEIAVDRLDGVILRLTETIGGDVTRHAETTHYEPDAPIPASLFEFELPAGTTLRY